MKVALMAFLLSWAGSWAVRRLPAAAAGPVRARGDGRPVRIGRLRPAGAHGPTEWLAAGELRLRPDAALGLWAGAAAVAALTGLLFGPGAAALLGVTGLAGPPWVLFRRRDRRDRRLAAALPDTLDRLATDLRGGGSLLGALRGVAAGPGPLAADFGRITERAAGGAALGDSIAAWPGERPLPAVAVAAAALEVAATVGGRSAAALEGLAAGLRDQRDTRQEAAALSAQARLSALVVGLAPLGSLGLSLMADQRVAVALVEPGLGRMCLAAGVGLEALAFLWMRRLIGASR